MDFNADMGSLGGVRSKKKADRRHGGGGGGNGQFVVGKKCQGVDLLWGILASETEVREDNLGSDVKYCNSTGKMVYSYPSQGALYSKE